MGKLLIEFIIPAALLLGLLWLVLKMWYFKWFPRIIKNHNKLNAATAKYDRQLQPKPKRKAKRHVNRNDAVPPAEPVGLVPDPSDPRPDDPKSL